MPLFIRKRKSTENIRIFAAEKTILIMHKAETHTLKDLIHDFVNKNGKQKLYAERTVMDRWPEYVGEMCAAQSQCISIRNGVLKVKVPNAALRFELNGRKSMIIERINADYTIPVIQNIMFF